MGMGMWRSVRHVYCSLEPKMRSIAEAAVSEYGIAFTLDDAVHELRRSTEWEYDYVERVARAFAEPGVAVAPGWESVEAAGTRAMDFIRGTVAAGPLPAAVVSGGIVLSTIRAALLGKSRVDPAEWGSLPFAAVAELETDGWRLISEFTAA
jgi:broad specificity phosphatase PhoE